jgi:hypothetical protein
MANILKLAAAALRSVPTPRPGVNANDYAKALHDWHKSHVADVYLHAANLAITVAQLTEAQDTESTKLLAFLEGQAGAPSTVKLPTDIMSNGRTRADHNKSMREVMRRRSEKSKAAKESA